MKRTVAFFAFLLCLALVLFTQPALDAAKTALALWWEILLPTLFPFFASATLMERTGALHMLANLLHPLSKRLRISCYALPMLLLGGISGYPSGARLCGMLQRSNNVSGEEAERLGTLCNLCSPMFLMGAVAGGMFSNIRLFLPLAVSHYGSAVIVAVVVSILRPIRFSEPPRLMRPPEEPMYRVLPLSITDGMADMLKVGGSVVFFLVLAAILKEMKIISVLGAPIDAAFDSVKGDSPSQGILLGLLEMTGGCHLISETGMPVLFAIPICSFLISFGGLSIMVQAMAFVEFRHPMRYLSIKMLQGILAAGIAYAILALSPGSTEVFSSIPSMYAINAITGLSVLFATALGTAAAVLLALIFGRRERRS